MEAEDIVELSVIAVIVIGMGFILYEAFKFFGDTGGTSAVAATLAPITRAEDTLLGTGDSAGTPGSDSNLFYTGINNAMDKVTSFFGGGEN